MFFEGTVLAIETSCDETSVALLRDGRILANVVSSQIELHKKWGGIVPEAAARAHVESFLPVLSEALEISAIELAEVGAIAVTNRPGLVGSLSVGITAAKALAFSLKVPLVGVHHLEGHLLSPLLDTPRLPFPNLCLLVSGGHTELVHIQNAGMYRIVGETRDDAAGEAFDKSARLLGLSYPGGKAIQDLAARGNSTYRLPKGLEKEGFDFSFSGLKTAVLRLVEAEGVELRRADAAASVQEAIVSVLAEKTLIAADELGVASLSLAGGVAANVALRQRLAEGAAKRGLPFAVPDFEYCTDNAAMIALAGAFRLSLGEHDDWDLDALSNAPLPSASAAV